MAKKSFFSKLLTATAKAVIAEVKRPAPKKKSPSTKATAQALNAINKQRLNEAFLIEYEDRARILQESVNAIQITNSISVVENRYRMVKEHWNWMVAKRGQGFPVIMDEEPEGFGSSLNRMKNFHLSRVIKDNYTTFQLEVSKLKSKKAIEDRFVKFFSVIKDAEGYLENHKNKTECKTAINEVLYSCEELYQNYA